MVRPAVAAGVKEPNGLSRMWIDRSHVAPLVSIADYASVRQVVGGGCAAVLAADDVVDLVREAGIIFTDEAVLASPTGTPGYLGS